MGEYCSATGIILLKKNNYFVILFPQKKQGFDV